jgi:tetraacyldisaccharide 4'-kinase
MSILRILLIPISLLYGLATTIRNILFNLNILPSKKFDLPIITIGNLSVGGTGKTPHVEYILNLFNKDVKLATLSRGYKRKTSGFILADSNSTVYQIGDESKQISSKFPKVAVAVDANRKRGIKNLISKVPELKSIILDDAFQHRYVEAGLNILVTPSNSLYIDDFLMPTGRLRESKRGSKRADIIIVSKSDKRLSPLERRMIRTKLKPQPYQKVYFSYYEYGDFVPLFKKNKRKLDTIFGGNYSGLLVTGIAKANDLQYYLENNLNDVKTINFADHHDYTISDAIKIKKLFDNIVADNRIIITTEKDAIKLKSDRFSEVFNDLPIYYLPIQVKFHKPDETEFNEQITKYVRNNKIYSGVHKE